jgi:hypothetical protein
MKQIKLIAAALFIIAAVSCTKSKNELPQPSQPSVEKKLISASTIYGSDPAQTMELIYDAQGRLSIYKDDEHKYFFSYDAGSKLNITRKKLSDGQPDQLIECDLNEKGAITKMLFKESNNTNTYMYEYFYDANGYKIKQKGQFSGYLYEEEYVIVNGNPVSSKLYYDGVYNSKREYHYDEKILNKSPFTVGSSWPSDRLFGKPAKNIMIDYKTFDTNNVLTWDTKYTYKFDADNYPVQQTTEYILQGEKNVATYTYQ